MEFGKAFNKDLVEVMLAHNRIQLDFDIGINLAKVLNLLAQSVETNGLATAFPPDFHVGFVIHRINGYSDLRNQVREWTEIFEMATIGDDGNFHFVGVGCFYYVPQAFGKHNRLATDNVESDVEDSLTAEMVADVHDNLLHVFGIAPDFDRFVPLGKAEVAVIVAGFGDVPVDDDDFFDIHKFSSQDCCEWLDDDDAGLDEKSADVTVVIPSEVCKCSQVARRTRDNEELGRSIGNVAQDGVFCMPSQGPSSTSQHCVAHFVDFGVV